MQLLRQPFILASASWTARHTRACAMPGKKPKAARPMRRKSFSGGEMDFVSKQFNFAPGERCIVIGEIGVNHNRREDLLFRLIDEGIAAGLDVIKLQRFESTEEISTYADSTEYQRKAQQGDSQLEMAKKLELPDEWPVKAYAYCKERNVGFLCTAFERKSVDFLAKKLR